MTIFQELRAVRESKGISRNRLASLIGRAEVSIARYELGTEEPPLRVLRDIAAALGGRIRISYEPNDNGEMNACSDNN